MITIIGKCVGIAEVKKGNGEKAFTQTVIGVAAAGDNAFGSETVTEIVIGDRDLSDQLKAQINKFKGQECQIVVNINNKIFRNNVQTTFYFNELLPAPNYIKTAA